MSEKVAAYFGSRNLYEDMLVSSKSLLKNTKIDRVYFLIEDDEYPYSIPENISVINVGKLIPQWFDEQSPNYKTGWTHIGLTRVVLSKVFLNLDKILTIDCDTIVTQDISDLWDIPLDNYWFAAVKEPTLSSVTHSLYVNAGVMLLNLKKLRDEHKDDEMINLLNTKRFTFVAQDAMNALCQGGIYELPGDYNASRYTTFAGNPRVHHFAGSRNFGWRNQGMWKEYKAMEF